jgi:RNA polymerase sigma-70 factor (ECF subfamily)
LTIANPGRDASEPFIPEAVFPDEANRDTDLRTSATLLGRLRQVPADQAAWGDFSERYGRKIYGWCRQWGLQEADAQDVTQAVLIKLVEKLRSFDYDPSRSFRGWLRTVARHTWNDYWDSRKRVVASGGTQAAEMLSTVEARESLMQRLEAEFDRELVEEAMVRVRQRVTPRTWRAFEMMAMQGQSGADTAKSLGMKVATVFVAKSKVQKLLQAERKMLEGDNP